MKLFRESKYRKIKMPKINIKPIVLGTGIVLSMFSTGATNLTKSTDINIPKGILFYGDNSGDYFKYVNSDKQEESLVIKDKIELNDFTLNGDVKVVLGDYGGYYEVKNDPNYKIDDTLLFLKNFENQTDSYSLSINYDIEYTSQEEIFEAMPILDNVKELSFSTFTTNYASEIFTVDIAQNINEKFPNLEIFNLSTSGIDIGALESLTNLKAVCIEPVSIDQNDFVQLNINTDFKKLTHLEELKINDKDYNVPIYFTLDEYSHLIKNGTKVEMSADLKTYIDVCTKLDQIVNDFNFTEDSTIRDKINAVCGYVLENLTYDPELGNREYDYYKYGMLYPVFNDTFEICGNYAALTEALFHRIFAAERSEIVNSKNHAWNQIEIDGKEYHIDTTWMENTKAKVMSNNEIGPNNFVDIFILEALKNNDKFINNWFLQSEESIRSNDTFEDHNILDIDKNVEIKKEERERAKEEQVRLLERRKFERISLIILMGLEIACIIKLSKDIIRDNKRQKECDAISNSDDMIKTR